MKQCTDSRFGAHPLCYWWLLLLLSGGGKVLPQEWSLNTRSHLRNAVIPIMPESGSQPLATIRAKSIRSGFQKQGFFRIGVLPMLMIEDLSIEVYDSSRLSDILGKARLHVTGAGATKGALEARSFSLTLAGPVRTEVHAQSIQLNGGAEWLLKDGTVSQPGRPIMPFHRATLIVQGYSTGDISCETPDGPLRLQLLPVTLIRSLPL